MMNEFQRRILAEAAKFGGAVSDRRKGVLKRWTSERLPAGIDGPAGEVRIRACFTLIGDDLLARSASHDPNSSFEFAFCIGRGRATPAGVAGSPKRLGEPSGKK